MYEKHFVVKEKTMNTKISAYILEKLCQTFDLPRYDAIRDNFSTETDLDTLPWTPVRRQKFVQELSEEFDFAVDITGTVHAVTDRTDQRYMSRFFGEVWRPRTEEYTYSGWSLVDKINAANPRRVLDYGCGYNQFKGRIPNLIGIDPYNNCADYMVDIVEFSRVESENFDHIIAFGSLNFNSRADIEERFQCLVSLLMPGGRMYFRVNPGIAHANGPWVDIFPWSFEIAYELANNAGLEMPVFKRDFNDRLYFEYVKPVLT